jgi:hypothetical protein
MPKFKFKRSSETAVETPVEAAVEPLPTTAQKGIPAYARFNRRSDSPQYDKTSEFLKRDPLHDIPIGALALASRDEDEWEPIGEYLTGPYNVFPWEVDDLPEWEDVGDTLKKERLT